MLVPPVRYETSRKTHLVPEFPQICEQYSGCSDSIRESHDHVVGPFSSLGLLAGTSPAASGVYLDADGDAERNARSESEWIEAVLVYLRMRSGEGWRRNSVERRASARYWEYTEPQQVIQEQMYKEQPPCNCAAHCLPVYGYRWMKPIPALPLTYPGEKFFKAHPHLEPTFQNGKYRGTRVKATAPAPAQDEDTLKRLRRAKRESMQLYRMVLAREDAGQDATALRAEWKAKQDEVDAIAQGRDQRVQEMATA